MGRRRPRPPQGHLRGQPAGLPLVAGAGQGGTAHYGRLVNTSTGLLLYGGAGQSNYVAAKGGVARFTDALATEMAPYGVTVNAVMPSGDDPAGGRRLAHGRAT